MTFDEILAQIIDLLYRQGRVSYGALKRRYALDDAYLEDLKDEIIYAQKLAEDEDNRVLVWVGDKDAAQPLPPAPFTSEPTSAPTTEQEREPLSYTPPHLAEKILTSRSALEGERKQVTVLFCDLRNSTAIAEKIGAEAMHGLLSRFFELAMDEVHRYEGTVNQLLGDGFMALFGAPIAHEDHARRAVFAALDLQRTLRDHHEELGGQHGVELAFRMGLNTGMVVVGSVGSDLRLDYTAIGDTTNLAARLEQIAEPGTILVSETTNRLVQGYVRLEALEPVEVKGKTEPVSTYKVLGTLPRRSPIVSRSERSLSEFVGRERELTTLEELLTQVKVGNGQVVGVVAEAGQGKSRLLYEFRQHLAGKQVTYLEGRCLSYGQTIPYHPIIDMLRNNCDITETDSPEAIIDKVRSALQEVGMDAEESAPYLLQLLGVKEGAESIVQLTPEAIRTRTFETLRRMSLQGSQRRPLIFEVEDLHWMDKTSEDYLASLVENLAGASILLLTTYRPGYRPPWIEKSYATQISLHSLAPQDGLTVVHSALHGATLSDQVEQMVIEKAEGNPFFLEELTRAVIEQSDIETAVQVPDTIQGVLSARIDRLPEEHKRLLQTASVLGREFSPTVLNAMWEGTDALDTLLLELKRLEFLYERSGAEEPIFVFRHALTQDVAYASLLTTRRQALHAAAGHALEALYPNGLTERSEALAYHFRLGEVWEKAFDYLAMSGDKARQAYANQEAITFYTQAIEVSERMTPTLDEAQLLPIYKGRGLVWNLVSQRDEAIADFEMMRQIARASGHQRQEGESLCRLAAAYHLKTTDAHRLVEEHYAQEAIQLAQQTGDHTILAMSLDALGRVHQVRGDLQEADRHLDASLQISQREGDKDVRASTLRALSAQAYWQGHFQRAIRFGQESVTLCRELHEGFLELTNLAFLCLAHWSAGNSAQALNIVDEGITKAQERGSRYGMGRLTNTLGWFHRDAGDLCRASEYDHESIDLGKTAGISNIEVSALINLGLDYLALSQHDRALSYLTSTLDRVEREAFGAHRWRWTIRLLIGLAELSYTTGEYEQALRYVEAGLKEAQRTSSQKYVALGWSLRGKIAAKLGDTDTAGTELQQAFTLADQLQSPSLIYPIAYDLGQWHESTGKEREAATLYGTAKATIEQMATAVEDEALRSTFLQSALVQEIHERATRLGG
jgi:class 3 adenylate cyclase/tetratricopeptide (TPR) repeat protein